MRSNYDIIRDALESLGDECADGALYALHELRVEFESVKAEAAARYELLSQDFVGARSDRDALARRVQELGLELAEAHEELNAEQQMQLEMAVRIAELEEAAGG